MYATAFESMEANFPTLLGVQQQQTLRRSGKRTRRGGRGRNRRRGRKAAGGSGLPPFNQLGQLNAVPAPWWYSHMGATTLETMAPPEDGFPVLLPSAQCVYILPGAKNPPPTYALERRGLRQQPPPPPGPPPAGPPPLPSMMNYKASPFGPRLKEAPLPSQIARVTLDEEDDVYFQQNYEQNYDSSEEDEEDDPFSDVESVASSNGANSLEASSVSSPSSRWWNQRVFAWGPCAENDDDDGAWRTAFDQTKTLFDLQALVITEGGQKLKKSPLKPIEFLEEEEDDSSSSDGSSSEASTIVPIVSPVHTKLGCWKRPLSVKQVSFADDSVERKDDDERVAYE